MVPTWQTHDNVLRRPRVAEPALLALARRRQILSTVWGPAHTEDTQYLRLYIRQLRQKIEPNPNDPRLITMEIGIGYRILDAG